MTDYSEGFATAFFGWIFTLVLIAISFNINGCIYRKQIEKSQVIYVGDQGYKCEKVK